MRIARAQVSLVFTAAIAILVPLATSGSAATLAAGSITGVVFDDADRDGVKGAGETSLGGHLIYLFDAGGSYVAKSTSAPDGSFAFPAVPGGAYEVRYAAQTWWELRAEWVPTTTGSLKAVRAVTVAGDVRADFGWRRIVRSADPSAPLDAFDGPQGLRVRSYIDTVSAREIYDAAMRGTVGEEASTVLIRFGLSSASSATTSVVESGGIYSSFAATINLDYISWLDSGDRNLGHEYGHAWSLYHAYLTQQDDTLAAYLRARGLADDPRVGSTYLWSARELIAEDYRQLLGSETASVGPQANRELPPAGEVSGLEAFLRDVFTVAPPAGEDPVPAPSPTVAPSDEPTTEPTADPTTEPTAEPTTEPTADAPRGKKAASSPGKGKGNNK